MLAGVRNVGLDDPSSGCSDLHCNFGDRSIRGMSSGGKHAAQVPHAGRTGGTVRHPPHSSENPEFLSSHRVRVAPARTGTSRTVEPNRISAAVISCSVRCRSPWGKFAVKVGGGHAVHEEVAAGDERPVGAHEQHADGPYLIWGAARPTGDNSIMRRYPLPRGRSARPWRAG